MERLFDLDAQLLADAILLAISMFVLFLLMGYLLFNPVRDMLRKRQEKIRNDLDTAAKEKEDAMSSKAEYEAKLRDVEKEAAEILSEARKKALANENRIIAEAKEEAARIVERANVEAQLEKQKMVDEVKQEMVTIASALAGKVVASSMDISIQNALVEETLKEMGDDTWLN